MEIGKEDIEQAYTRIKSFIHKTPILRCQYIDQLTGKEIYFKAENFQKTGSFKARGVFNALLCLKKHHSVIPKVIAHSSGNHAQALAYACKIFGLPCTVVMTTDTNEVKVNAVKFYEGEIVFCEPDLNKRVEVGQKILTESGGFLIHSYNQKEVIAGQATIVSELLEDIPDLDAIFVAVGGGGLLGGITAAVKYFKPSIKVFAVEPEGKELQKCLEAGEKLCTNSNGFLKTIADGIRIQQLGNIAWNIVKDSIEKKVFTVTDSEIISAMRLVMERMKIVIEPSAAAPVAAILSQQFKEINPTIKKVAIILCGGNIDLTDSKYMLFKD